MRYLREYWRYNTQPVSIKRNINLEILHNIHVTVSLTALEPFTAFCQPSWRIYSNIDRLFRKRLPRRRAKGALLGPPVPRGRSSWYYGSSAQLSCNRTKRVCEFCSYFFSIIHGSTRKRYQAQESSRKMAQHLAHVFGKRALEHNTTAAAIDTYQPGDRVLIWGETIVESRIGEWARP